MTIHVFETEQELLTAYAELFVKTAHEAQLNAGEFNVVLSGGNSPKKLYELLTTHPFSERINWKKINFFLGDERYVPLYDPQSNALMIKKALFNPLQIAASQIFFIDTSLPAEQAAEKYMEAIRSHFKNKPIRFDLIMLGLGDNAHTASLFPHTSVLSETLATMRAVFLQEQNVYRITMTAPLINQAHHIAFMVYGAAKADAVHQVLKGATNIAQYPAQLIQPDDGDLRYFLDTAAAAGL